MKKEGKSCIGGAKYAAKKYLPPPSKMSGVTFHSDEHANSATFEFLGFLLVVALFPFFRFGH